MAVSLFSLVKNEVDIARSEESDQFTINGLDSSKVRKALKGIGVLYFWNVPTRYKMSSSMSWRWKLYLAPGETRIQPLSLDTQGTTFSIERADRFACCGVITGSGEGYLIAPTVMIDIAFGRDIALMLVSPRTSSPRISLEKQALSIPDAEANLIVSNEADGLRCTGSISGSKFKAAKLTLNRNPNLPIYKGGFNEELCQLTEPGEINVAWKPAARNFAERVFVFHPGALTLNDLATVSEWLGTPLGALDNDLPTIPASSVISDGSAIDYRLRLTVERRFRSSFTDETRLLLT